MFRVVKGVTTGLAFNYAEATTISQFLPFSACISGVISWKSQPKNDISCRFYSSMRYSGGFPWQKVDNNVAGLDVLNGSLSRLIAPSVLFDQRRGYWGNEGRVGWRRKRRKAMTHREQILNPSSPVIDYRVPWPKDDMESLPPDLFGVDREELSPQEVRSTQNAIVQQINDQFKDDKEGRLFAILHIQGKQFKVTPEDIIMVQGYFPPSVGDQLRIHKIMLVGGKDFTLVGRPLLDNDLIRVEATVIEKTLSYTKFNFKMRKRKNYRRLRFSKEAYTMLRINLIELMEPLSMIRSDSESYSQLDKTVTM